MTAFVRCTAFLFGLGFLGFGLFVSTWQLQGVATVTARDLNLLDHPDLWDQYFGVWFGSVIMVEGGVVGILSATCFRQKRQGGRYEEKKGFTDGSSACLRRHRILHLD